MSPPLDGRRARKVIFFDVGAHKGETLAGARRFSFDEIHCFEPAAENWPHLETGDPRVTVHRYGLWNRTEQRKLFKGVAAKRPELGSFSSSIFRDKMNVSDDFELVDIREAAEVFRGFDLDSHVAVLKINVEGAECDIIDNLIDAGLFGRFHKVLLYFDVRKVKSLRDREATTRARFEKEGLTNWVDGDALPRNTVQGRTAQFIDSLGLVERLPVKEGPAGGKKKQTSSPPVEEPRQVSEASPGSARRAIAFLWPINPNFIAGFDRSAYQLNHLEKIRHFERLFDGQRRFEYINEIDSWKQARELDLSGRVAVAHMPYAKPFNDEAYKAYCASLMRAERLVLFFPGAVALRRIAAHERELVERADRIVAWCGRYWYDRLVEENHPAGFLNFGGNKVVHILPAIHLPSFEFRPHFKRDSVSLFHASKLSPVKGPDLLFASLPREGARLYLGSYEFGMAEHDFDLTLGSGAEARQVRFHAPNIGPCKPNSMRPVDVRVDGWGHETHRRIVALGYMKNSDDFIDRFLYDSINYYYHTSNSEGLASTVMENVARGLLPVVTVECGLNAPSAVYLSDDPVKNRAIIAGLKNMTKAEYYARVQAARDHLAEHHTWERAAQALADLVDGV